MSWIRLYLMVEGETELEFAKQAMTPHLAKFEVDVRPRMLLTNRMRNWRKCLEMAGREIGKAAAMCPAGCGPRRKRSSTASRVGSASAWNVASGKYVTERFRIMRNYTVTR